MRERFEREASEHRMRVFRDDGLYRHLRFTRRETWAYGYDLITWPGYLAIAGDCGDYTFARVADMFEFFRGGRNINPDYWSEKLTNHDMRDGTRRFEPDLFRPRVLEWYERHCESYPDEDGSLRRALDEQVFWKIEGGFSRDYAIGLLYDFNHDDGTRIYEPWDWRLDDWDWQFLWCCWAIVQGIAQYDWSKGWK